MHKLIKKLSIGLIACVFTTSVQATPDLKIYSNKTSGFIESMLGIPIITCNKAKEKFFKKAIDASSRLLPLPEKTVFSITKDCSEIHVNMQLTIGLPFIYEDLISILGKLKEEQTIIFHYANFGGYVHTGSMLMNAIKATEAHTISQVDGPSYSMAAVLSCSTDEVDLRDMSFLMYHTYRGAEQGNGQEILSGTLAVHKLLRNMLKTCSDKGIIEESDIENILNGKDLYVFPEDLK